MFVSEVNKVNACTQETQEENKKLSQIVITWGGRL